MIIELIISLLAGVILGTITGLLPGIHINLISTLLLSLPFLIISPICSAVFIVSLSITHIFIDFIPSIFLGCPNSDTSLSILPGHELLLEGEGIRAVHLSIIGAFIGTLLLIPIGILFIFFLPKVYGLLNNIMPFILIIILLTMFIFEKNKIAKTFLIIFLSGFLGLCVLSFNLNINEPLLPLLSGLFGASSLIISSSKSKIPIQKNISLKKSINSLNFTKPILASLISSPFCSFLPGLGSNQASTIGAYTLGDLSREQFLVLIGIANSLVLSLSIVTLYTINKSRTGTSAYLSKLLETLSFNDLIILIIVIILTSIITFILTLYISKKFSNFISKVNYRFISIIILIFISLLILSLTGILGFFIFIISTSIGITCILLNVKRTTMMACLLIPTIYYYIL